MTRFFLFTTIAVLLCGPARVFAEQPQDHSAAGQQVPAASQPPRPARRHIETYTLPPEKYAEAVTYSHAGYRLYFFDVFYGLVALLAVLRWRLPARYRDWAEHASRLGFVQALVFAPLLFVTLRVLHLPLSLYGHSLSLHYHQSVQGWGSWFLDWTKGLALEVVAAVFLVWLLYAVIRRSPRRWWLYFWLALLPVMVFVVFIEPLVVEPMFFHYQPLEQAHPQLVAAMEKVAARSGLVIPPERFFEMRASVKTNSLNAYVTGIGPSKRVVVLDTTMKKMDTPEILFVFGHELGHYVLGHIWKGMLVGAGVLLVFLWLGYRAVGWTVRWCGAPWQLRGVADYASLPVLLIWLSILGFLSSPLLEGYSRYQEHQADVYGLEVIHGLVPDFHDVAAEAFQVLGEEDLADPAPSRFIVFWLYSHPSIPQRVRFAQRYDPWAQGKEPRFVKTPAGQDLLQQR